MWLLAATYNNAAFLCSHSEAPESGIFYLWVTRACGQNLHELAQYKSDQHALNYLLIFLKL